MLGLAALSALFASAPARAQVTAVALSVSKPSPQKVNTPLTFTATVTGSSAAYEYKFWLAKGAGAFEPLSVDYVPGNILPWTPTEVDSYRIRVYARSQGSTELYEKMTSRTYYVVAETPVRTVKLFSSVLSPQIAGAALSFSATALRVGVNGAEYQFWLTKGTGAPRLVKDYDVGGNTWVPLAGDMDVADSYLVKVNARNKGSIAPLEKFATKPFEIVPYAPVVALTLRADKPSPQDLATVGTVTFTAAATTDVPGTAVEYSFWLFSNTSGQFVAVGDVTNTYSTADTWHWTPAVADEYKVKVLARQVGAAKLEKLKVVSYTVSAFPPTLGEVIPSVVSSPAGSPRTFSAVYSDVHGHAGLKLVGLLVNETESEAHGISVRYDRPLDMLYLLNDDGTADVGSCAPGSTDTLTNNQGSLNCADTTVTGSGDDLTVDWSLTPSPLFVSTTAKNIYTSAQDNADLLAGREDKGDWTITAAIDFADCTGCHGCPPHVGADGYPGTGDDAPNVMGDGTSQTGTGTTPKPFDDGTWGFNVNGHGANGTASNTPRQMVDPGPPPLYVAYLTPNRACTDCHDISQPATGDGQHFNGILNSVDLKLHPSENTAHLRTDGAYPFIVTGSNQWSVQVGFDRACWLRCHQSSGVANMRHARDTVLAPAVGHETNFNNVADVVHFGDKGSRTDAQNAPYPVDTALTTNASDTDDDFAPCIACHDPHGTATVEPVRSTNRMVRDQFFDRSTICHVCHL